MIHLLSIVIGDINISIPATVITDLCQGVQCKFNARCEAGECVCPTDCESAGDELVCASNLNTYSNECELQKAACLQSKEARPLKAIFYGDCNEKFTPAGALSKFLIKLWSLNVAFQLNRQLIAPH